MKYSGFKQQVIRSGIPLENTIRQYLDSLGLIIYGEYTFERNDKLFSIDTHATNTLKFPLRHRDNLIELDLLIECKYKEPNHAWVFASYPDPTPMIQIHTLYSDFPFYKRLKDYGYNIKNKSSRYARWRGLDEIHWMGKCFPKGFNLVNAATEIISDKSFNPKAITEGIHQIVYATGSMLVEKTVGLIADEFAHTEDKEKYYFGGELAAIIYPVIVTTADLYLLKSNKTIEDIQKSKNINDCFKTVDHVLFGYIATQEVKNYISTQLDEYKSTLLKSSFFSEENLQGQFNGLVPNSIPIAIVKQSAFTKFINIVIKELNQYFITLSKEYAFQKKSEKKS